jgi:hypothetical protein
MPAGQAFCADSCVLLGAVAFGRGGAALDRGAVALRLGRALDAAFGLEAAGGVLDADTPPPATTTGSIPGEWGGVVVTGAFDAEHCVRRKSTTLEKNVLIRSAG